ncbi:MAG: hypothetical protein SLAVMIC_00552 [uncultured marine phage]|uniref:Uncharacterized protein n=1 Tax=uncultured marine phage TaxID=707152 RepID=A0A8D9FQV7_9VIRU|nr:MAG: hypothetical protein SLAVMIC_00552 [uncultured marine phage]
MMKPKRISNRSFERTSKRFTKVAIKSVLSFYDDVATKDRFDSEGTFYTEEMIEKLVSSYKRSPFRNKSAFTHKVSVFRNFHFIKDIKVSYEFQDDKLVFKLLTRTNSRFNRKAQFILNLK